MKDEPHDFYVYVYHDQRGTPRYVGKGRNKRDQIHLAQARGNLAAKRRGKTPWLRYLQAALRRGESFTIQRSQEQLTHEQANALEIALIAQHGRRLFDSSGTLLNTTTGGEGVDSETATIHAKRRAADPDWRKENNARMRRIHTNPEWRDKHRNAIRHRDKNPDWKAAIKRRTANPEWRAKTRAAAQRRAANPEWRAKNRAAMQRNAANPEWRANNRAALRSIARQRRYGTTDDPRQLALPL